MERVAEVVDTFQLDPGRDLVMMIMRSELIGFEIRSMIQYVSVTIRVIITYWYMYTT